jgi:UDP-galactopyranose mutase
MLDSGDLVPFPVNAETKKILGETNMVDIFYRPYTKKMWGVEIEDLDPNILSRVPMRLDNSDLYFPNETFQALPKNGYTAMVANIIDHPNIKILVNTSYEHHMEREFLHTFNSMPIDEFFGYEFGQLPYRSIKFHNVNLPLPRVFPVSTVNFTNNGPFTRVTEWKNFPNHGHNSLLTSLTFEEPCSFEDNNFERYYPVKDFQGINKNLFDKYLSMKKNNMTFIGRCGLYLYLDMHQAISSSISIVSKFLQQLSIDNQKGIIT